MRDHETFQEMGDALRSTQGVEEYQRAKMAQFESQLEINNKEYLNFDVQMRRELSAIGDRTTQVIGKTASMSNIINGKCKQVDELILQLEMKSKQAEDLLTQMKNFVGFLNERDDNVE